MGVKNELSIYLSSCVVSVFGCQENGCQGLAVRKMSTRCQGLAVRKMSVVSGFGCQENVLCQGWLSGKCCQGLAVRKMSVLSGFGCQENVCVLCQGLAVRKISVMSGFGCQENVCRCCWAVEPLEGFTTEGLTMTDKKRLCSTSLLTTRNKKKPKHCVSTRVGSIN